MLDEPFEGMDVLAREKFKGLILKAKDNGKTVLLSTHTISDVEELSDEVLVLLKGNLVKTVSRAELSAPQGYEVSVAIDGSNAEEAMKLLGINFLLQGGEFTARVKSQKELEELILSLQSSKIRIKQIVPIKLDLVKLFEVSGDA